MSWLRWLTVALALSGSVCLIQGSVCAATYYVSPDGSEAGDGSRAKPWSVAVGLGHGGGNTYVFLSGIYRGPIVVSRAQAGSPERPTVLKSDPKWKARIIGAPYHVITIDEDTPHVIIDGFEVLGAGWDGIKSLSDYTKILNCWVHSNSHMGIAIHGHNHETIENNLVEYNGINPQFHHGIYVDGEDYTIRANIVRHNAAWGMHLYPKMSRAIIVNNLVYGQWGRSGILVASPPEATGSIVANNTVADNAQGLDLRGGRGTVVANNIFVGNRGGALAFSNVVEPVVDYNLYDRVPVRKGVHDRIGDPGFLKPDRGVYWLSRGSMAIGVGTSKFAPDTELLGQRRPKDRPPDVGAYQFVEIPGASAIAERWQYRLSPTAAEEIPDLWLVPGASKK